MKLLNNCLVALLLIVSPWHISSDALHGQAATKGRETTQCSGLCDVCVALSGSSKNDQEKQVIFRDSLKSKSGAAAACGSFENKITSEGWGYLHVRTNEDVADIDQAWAAGFVEGYLTQLQIHQFHVNTASTRKPALTRKINSYVKAQRKYIERQIDKHGQSGDKNFMYWHHIKLLVKQLEGLHAGYTAMVKKRGVQSTEALTAAALWIINMDGDIIQLESAISKGVLHLASDSMAFRESSRKNMIKRKATSLSGNQLWEQLLLNSLSHHSYDGPAREATSAQFTSDAAVAIARATPSHADIEAEWKKKVVRQRCSVLVKLADNNDDLLVAHTSWEDYNEMLRVFKHFDTRFKGSKNGQQVSFSSYPGMLASTDDFYLTANQLVVTETTLTIMGEEPLGKMRADGIGSWMSTVVASRLATTAEEWANLFLANNAGTYSCQWMIIDYSRFKKGSAKQDKGLFWIVENVPGSFVSRDMTDKLVSQRYWQSANRPYFKRIRQDLGYQNGVPMTSFVDNPRAKIFARLQGSVDSVEKMKEVIRYNGYPNEVESNNDPSLTIAARYDLIPNQRQLTGATDGKVVGAADVRAMRVHAISGPSTENEPPFQFLKSERHEGMPDTYDFPWVVTVGGVIGDDGRRGTGESAAVSWLCRCHDKKSEDPVLVKSENIAE